MFFLFPLIIFAAAQQCPYCRWNACTLTEGSLASCSDCYLGTLVNYQLDQPGSMTNVTIGVCVFCPDNCNSCEYAVVYPHASIPIYVINCTDCVSSGFVNNYFSGKCQPCPENCVTCSCIGYYCFETMCSQCASGFTINLNTTTHQCQAQEGTRRLKEESSSAVSQGYSWGVVIGLSTLAMALKLGLSLDKKWNRAKESSSHDSSSPDQREMVARKEETVE